MKSRTNTRPHQTRSSNHHSPNATGGHHPRSTDGAREHYHREKARRAKARGPDDELLAAAKREYLALLEAEAAKGKGGRPKKKVAAPKDESGDELDEESSDEESSDE